MALGLYLCALRTLPVYMKASSRAVLGVALWVVSVRLTSRCSFAPSSWLPIIMLGSFISFCTGRICSWLISSSIERLLLWNTSPKALFTWKFCHAYHVGISRILLFWHLRRWTQWNLCQCRQLSFFCDLASPFLAAEDKENCVPKSLGESSWNLWLEFWLSWPLMIFWEQLPLLDFLHRAFCDSFLVLLLCSLIESCQKKLRRVSKLKSDPESIQK